MSNPKSVSNSPNAKIKIINPFVRINYFPDFVPTPEMHADMEAYLKEVKNQRTSSSTVKSE